MKKFLRIQNGNLREDLEDLQDSVMRIEMKMAELEKKGQQRVPEYF